MPSIVSPVRQNVPVKCLPLRPTVAAAKEACTRARCWPFVVAVLTLRARGSGAARIIRSKESIIFNGAADVEDQVVVFVDVVNARIYYLQVSC